MRIHSDDQLASSDVAVNNGNGGDEGHQSDKEQAIPKGDVEGQNLADQKEPQSTQTDKGGIVRAKKIEQFFVFQILEEMTNILQKRG